MKKHLAIFAVALMALCATFVACEKDNNDITPDNNDSTTNTDIPEVNSLVGVYDLEMKYDSITTSDGTWFDNEFFEMMTGKTNPPKHGYLTIAKAGNDKYSVTATFVEDDNSEKVFFTTTASEADGILTLDDCTSDYYYDNIEEMLRMTFHGFQNTLPTLYFKGIYTINLGYDYSYLNSYYCTKRQ